MSAIDKTNILQYSDSTSSEIISPTKLDSTHIGCLATFLLIWLCPVYLSAGPVSPSVRYFDVARDSITSLAPCAQIVFFEGEVRPVQRISGGAIRLKAGRIWYRNLECPSGSGVVSGVINLGVNLKEAEQYECFDKITNFPRVCVRPGRTVDAIKLTDSFYVNYTNNTGSPKQNADGFFVPNAGISGWVLENDSATFAYVTRSGSPLALEALVLEEGGGFVAIGDKPTGPEYIPSQEILDFIEASAPPLVLLSTEWSYGDICFPPADGAVESEQCESSGSFGVPLPTDDSGNYMLTAVTDRNGRIRSYNPGQIYSSSLITIQKQMSDAVIRQSYDTCVDSGILQKNPKNNISSGSVKIFRLSQDAKLVETYTAQADRVSASDSLLQFRTGPLEAGDKFLMLTKFGPGQRSLLNAKCRTIVDVQEVSSAGELVGGELAEEAMLVILGK